MDTMTAGNGSAGGPRESCQGGDQLCVRRIQALLWRGLLSLIVAPLLIVAAATPSYAGFVSSVSGSAAIISPPANSSPGSLVANTIEVWSESTGKLSSAVTVDLAGQNGNYDGRTNYTTLGTTLAKGTAYDSVMLQLDPAAPYSRNPLTASITFTNKIIGIALFGTSLSATDIYGSPTTIYPTGLPNLFLQTRGIDYTHSDMLSINGNTLTLQLPANYGIFDQIRVFTAASGAPEPASLFLWSTIGLIFAGRSFPGRIVRTYTSRRRRPDQSDL